MADQLTEEPYNRPPIVPPELGWKALLPLDRAALEDQYRNSLEKLGVKRGMLGVIFKGARCEIHNPALLKQLIVNLLDKVDWLSLPVDVKGTIGAGKVRGPAPGFQQAPRCPVATHGACHRGPGWRLAPARRARPCASPIRPLSRLRAAWRRWLGISRCHRTRSGVGPG